MSSSAQGPEASRPMVRATRHYRAWIIALLLLLVGLFFVIFPHIADLEIWKKDVAREVGVVLLTTGLISFIYELALRGSFIQEVEMLLRSHSELGNQGVIGIRTHLSTDILNEKFSGARKDIFILQTWIGNLIPIRESIVNATKRGCAVKILLLDPASPHAEFRGKEYGNTHKDFVGQQVDTTLTELRAAKDRINLSNLEIRLYDGTPIFTVYAADDEMFVGFYWRHLAATVGPQLDIQSDSLLGQQVHRHFDDLWGLRHPYNSLTRTLSLE
jgi:hypothetical protein